MEKIATKQGVLISLVSKVVHLHQLYGQVTDPFVHHAGCPSFLEHDDLKYLSAILDANPGLYLNEIQDKLATVRNLHVSIATVTHALQELDLTHKSTMRAAAHRDEELRTQWKAQMDEYTDPNLFVFLDESVLISQLLSICSANQQLVHVAYVTPALYGVFNTPYYQLYPATGSLPWIFLRVL